MLRNPAKMLLMWWVLYIYGWFLPLMMRLAADTWFNLFHKTIIISTKGKNSDVYISLALNFPSAFPICSPSAGGLGPCGSWWSSQHQKPKSSDLHGCLSAQGSCPLGSHRDTHSEQPFGHVLTAEVRESESKVFKSLMLVLSGWWMCWVYSWMLWFTLNYFAEIQIDYKNFLWAYGI